MANESTLSKNSLSVEAKWFLVDKVFDNGFECHYCPHLDRTLDRPDEPGGRQCGLMFNSAIFGQTHPELCPGYGKQYDLFMGELEQDLVAELEEQE